MSIVTFTQKVPQSLRSLNDFSVGFSSSIFTATLIENVAKRFTVPNEGSMGMGLSSGVNNRYVVIFKATIGSNVLVDPTGTPVVSTNFSRGTSEMITPGMARYVDGGTTLYFLTPDTAGAIVQAVVYYLPV